MNARCGAATTSNGGAPCRNRPVAGAKRCRKHGSAAPQVVRRALVRAELANWGLGDSTIDPGELLLRLTAQAAARAEFLADLLQEQYEKAEQGKESTSLPAGIAALVGPTFALSRDGKPVAIGEAVRALVHLEGIERDRAASFAAKAIAAGLEVRRVEQAERMGALIASVLQKVVHDPVLALSAEQKAAVGPAVRAALALAPGS